MLLDSFIIKYSHDNCSSYYECYNALVPQAKFNSAIQTAFYEITGLFDV